MHGICTLLSDTREADASECDRILWSMCKLLCLQWECMVLLVQAAAYEGPKRDILIDVGTADSFLENQLKPDDFSEAAAGNKALAVQLRKQARPTPRLLNAGVVLPWLAHLLFRSVSHLRCHAELLKFLCC